METMLQGELGVREEGVRGERRFGPARRTGNSMAGFEVMPLFPALPAFKPVRPLAPAQVRGTLLFRRKRLLKLQLVSGILRWRAHRRRLAVAGRDVAGKSDKSGTQIAIAGTYLNLI